MSYRTEKDVLGSVKIHSSMYYGSETERAIENFPISGLHIQEEFIKHYVILKRAAAAANMKIKKLEIKKGSAIMGACDKVIRGGFNDQFVVDVFQAGAGTSTNMNINEVIANVSIEILKGKKGDYNMIHPNDHVNMSQSTNDTYHTATRMAAYSEIRNTLLPSLLKLEESLKNKSEGFKNITKVGRTHLQDAVPITFGQEFSGYSESVRYCIRDLERAMKELLEVPLGGTALGTGINASNAYAKYAILKINEYEKAKFFIAENMFAAMQNEFSELVCSNSLKDTAITLNKIANDLRLSSSGPRAGISEIILPAVQPGSSIMPGKINPSMAEMLNMVCFQVIGNSCVIDNAANNGQLEINVFMPIITFNLLFSIKILSNGIAAFEKRCIRGITIDKQHAKSNLNSSISTAAALSPYIGYAKASEIAREAYLKKKSVMDICLSKKILSRKDLERILDPGKLTHIR